MHNRSAWVLGAAWVALAGCVGTIGADDTSDSGGYDPNDSNPRVFHCDTDTPISASPMRRLSYRQYVNTLGDLVGHLQPQGNPAAIMATLDTPLTLLPHDHDHDYRNFDNDSSQAHIDAYWEVAIALAGEVTADAARLEQLAGSCATDSDASNDAACVEEFVRRFGMLALRRPLSDDEVAFYAGDAVDDPISVAPESFAERVTVLLQAPQFVYRIEDGMPAGEDPDLFPLSGYELASRLSYLLWQSMPDQELFDAAANGTLDTEDGFAAQLARVWNDPRTQVTIDQFFSEWLRLEELPPMDAEMGTPAFDAFAGSDAPGPELTAHMTEEVMDLFRYYIWNTEGSFDDVLLSDLSFAKTADLAAIYGMPPWNPGSAPDVFPTGQRAGLLTRAALVASASASTRPVMKGKLIRTRVLCDELPDPPADLGELPELAPDMTVRERLDEITLQPGSSCAGCHVSMNALGYVTESFDGLGRYRTSEKVFDQEGNQVADKPVDTTAVPYVSYEDDSPMDSGLQLSEAIADDGKAHACLTRHYFRYSYGRVEDLERDGCALEGMRGALVDTSLRAMLEQAAMEEAFKLRRRDNE